MAADFAASRGKYMVGVRGAKGAPMGKSVFRLLRAAHPDMSNLTHQPPLANFGHEPLPFKASGPLGGAGK